MRRFIQSNSQKSGMAPGTVVHVGKRHMNRTLLEMVEYTNGDQIRKKIKKVEDCFSCKRSRKVSWVNVTGLQDTKLIEKLGAHFGIHPIILEDIVHTGQRPKVEDMDDYLFCVMKILYFDKKQKEMRDEQVSFIVFPKLIISFLEREHDVFDVIHQRIAVNKGRIRKAGTDFLFYSLIDAIVDDYFFQLENTGEKIEKFEDSIIENTESVDLEDIHKLKQEVMFLRKSVWPTREMLTHLMRIGDSIMKENTLIYLRDVYDHTVQVIDTIDTYRDILSSMVEIYMSGVSNRMNQVMKVLTVIATIFIPLTFITGVYGMNFQYMPELSNPLGYFITWFIMISVGGFMVYYFRKKHWF